MPEHRRLDLARLDPDAADLHLVVGAADELQRPVGPPLREVARPVEPRSRLAERIGQESLGREPRSSDVAERHAPAPDVELARHPDGDGSHIDAQDVGAGARERAADRDRLVLRADEVALEPRAVDRRLGEAVRIEDARRGSDDASEPAMLADPPDVGADGDQPERVEPTARLLEVHRQRVGDRRDQLDELDPLAHHQVGERFGVEDDLTGGDDQRAARAERPDPIAGEDVEGRPRRLEVDARRAREAVGMFPSVVRADEAPVGDGHGLRRPRAAGRVDAVGDVRGRRGRRDRLRRVQQGAVVVDIECEGRLREVAQRRPPDGVDEDRRDDRVAEQEGQALPGMGRVERQVRPPRFQDGR